MSVAELRTQLTYLAAQLPVAELSAAHHTTTGAQARLATAWRGSGHPSAEAAVTAASTAADCLAGIIASVEHAASDIADYHERL